MQTEKPTSLQTHRCYRCKRNLPFEKFGENRSKPNGIATECKECAQKQRKISYQKNKYKHYLRHKAWVKKNREKKRALQRKYYLENKSRQNPTVEEWIASIQPPKLQKIPCGKCGRMQYQKICADCYIELERKRINAIMNIPR